MPSSSYTPSTAIDMSKEKDWASSLGLLDWDSTNIVFTKRSLIEFLKYIGTTVDPSFGNIQKLPRYAKFGKISEGAAGDTAAAATTTTQDVSNASDDFKPSRRVRTVPGGPHTNIFAQEDDDALATAPPRDGEAQAITAAVAVSTPSEPPAEEEESGINFASSVKPSRRVRTTPGGPSSMSNLWDSQPTVEEFKPTRRVRQGPGGQDHINDFF